MDPEWLSFISERQFNAKPQKIDEWKQTKFAKLGVEFEFICERQFCRVCII